MAKDAGVDRSAICCVVLYMHHLWPVIYFCVLTCRKKEGSRDWLCSNQVNHEQYLLGKRIDRQVDPLLASEDRERQVDPCVSMKPLSPTSSFSLLFCDPLGIVLFHSGTGKWAWGTVHRT